MGENAYRYPVLDFGLGHTKGDKGISIIRGRGRAAIGLQSRIKVERSRGIIDVAVCI